MENFNKTFYFSKNDKEKEKENERIRNLLFAEEVCNEITKKLEDEAYEVYFNEDSIKKIREKILKYIVEDRKRILSYPFEIRKNLLRVWKEKIDNDEKTEEDFVEFLLAQAIKNNWDIGYHLSKSEINPKEDNTGKEIWDIDGLAKDERDDNHPKAYYSDDYMSRYIGPNSGNFLYLIRSEKGDESSHGQDGNNKWGRASKLSVIERVNLSEIENKVNKRNEERRKKILKLFHH